MRNSSTISVKAGSHVNPTRLIALTALSALYFLEPAVGDDDRTGPLVKKEHGQEDAWQFGYGTDTDRVRFVGNRRR